MKTNNEVIVSIAKNSEIKNSKVGVIENHYHNPSFESNYRESLSSIIEDIDALGDNTIKIKLKRIICQIDNHFKKDKKSFEELMNNISCSSYKLPTVNQIRNCLIFFVAAILHCDFDITLYNFEEIIINDTNNWIFSPHSYAPISIEKSISKILEYIFISQLDKFDNSICFISNLSNDGRIDCNECVEGVLNIIEGINIIGDFMNDNKYITLKDKNIQADFLDIKTSRDIIFKCGNCVTDIERVEQTLDIIANR